MNKPYSAPSSKEILVKVEFGVCQGSPLAPYYGEELDNELGE